MYPQPGAARRSRVTSNYVGANAETVEKAVTIPLEEAINGVEGMRYISSSSTNSGSQPDHRSPSRPATTSTSRPSTCRTAWPACRAACPRRSTQTGITITKVELQLRLRRRLLHARRPLLDRVHLQLPRRLRQGRAQARARRGRRHDLRRAQVRHARLARSGAAGRPRPDRHRRGERACRSRTSRFRPASSASPRRTPSRPSRFRCAWSAGSPSPAEFDNIIVKNSPNGLVQLKDVGHSVVGAEDYSSALEVQRP